MERRFQGVLKFKRFFGVKAGRSIWKESFVKTRVYADPSPASFDLCFFQWLFGRESAGSFRIFIGLYEDYGRKLSVFPSWDRLAFADAYYKYVHGYGDGCDGGGILFRVAGL